MPPTTTPTVIPIQGPPPKNYRIPYELESLYVYTAPAERPHFQLGPFLLAIEPTMTSAMYGTHGPYDLSLHNPQLTCKRCVSVTRNAGHELVTRVADTRLPPHEPTPPPMRYALHAFYTKRLIQSSRNIRSWGEGHVSGYVFERACVILIHTPHERQRNFGAESKKCQIFAAVARIPAALSRSSLFSVDAARVFLKEAYCLPLTNKNQRNDMLREKDLLEHLRKGQFPIHPAKPLRFGS